MPTVRIGLVSDTHGVVDPAVAAHFSGCHHILHAGDVGNHGGHQAVLAVLQAVAPTTAVAGNVDDAPGTSLPQHAVVEINGHRVLLHHIVEGKGQGQVTPQAAALIQQQRPDIVVFGHSHRNTVRWLNGRLLVNPGSAGPARFKLPRTIAILEMPPKESSSDDSSKLDVQVITLDAKAPRRAAGTAPSPKRRKAVVKKEAPLP